MPMNSPCGSFPALGCFVSSFSFFVKISLEDFLLFEEILPRMIALHFPESSFLIDSLTRKTALLRCTHNESLLQGYIPLANKKKTLFSIPFQLLTILGPKQCAEHDGVHRFTIFVLVFPYLYVEIRKKTISRHISTAITPFIYFHLQKYHITNEYHKQDFASMQKFLEIHCLHWKKRHFVLSMHIIMLLIWEQTT